MPSDHHCNHYGTKLHNCATRSACFELVVLKDDKFFIACRRNSGYLALSLCWRTLMYVATEKEKKSKGILCRYSYKRHRWHVRRCSHASQGVQEQIWGGIATLLCMQRTYSLTLTIWMWSSIIHFSFFQQCVLKTNTHSTGARCRTRCKISNKFVLRHNADSCLLQSLDLEDLVQCCCSRSKHSHHFTTTFETACAQLDF